MNIICPCCQAIYPIEAALNDVAGRQAVVAAFSLTSFGDLLVGYTRLFTPPKRALSNARMAKLIEELLPMIREAKIERNGRIWNAPQDYWKMALAEMIEKRDKLTLPLKSHGYLLAIIENYSNKAEAKQEAQTEAQRGGRTPIGGICTSNRHIPETCTKKPEVSTDKPRGEIPAAVLSMVGLGKKHKEESDANG